MENKPHRIPLPSISPEPPPPAHPPAEPAPAPAAADGPPVPVEELREKVIDALSTCYDPEIPVNIYELGLVYDIDISPERAVHVRMTLTSPGCPVAGSLPPEVEAKVRAVPGVSAARVEVVWEPPWTMERMSEAAKLQLGIDDF